MVIVDNYEWLYSLEEVVGGEARWVADKYFTEEETIWYSSIAGYEQ